ncbi:GerW family sporulation protein [Halobacterium wangiae]|uniref:GerW family sporulation protein n=1 Tax=Halobacterium wangiae TaxID=2902623 RepID=UPI001E54B5AA|nr:spore germination protein GerW family protein [Halobacterium wangiae]
MSTDIDSMLAPLVDRLADAGDVGTVYGDPVEREDRTVIPVARVAWGFGGGAGTSAAEEGDDEEAGEAGGDEGYGMGGGVRASPVGALEIGEEGTRFVRYGDRKRLLGFAVLAFFVGVLLGRR